LRARVHGRARALALRLLRERAAVRLRRLLLLVAVLALVAPPAAFARGEFHPEDEWKLEDWVPIHIGGLNPSINKAAAHRMLSAVLTILLAWLLMRFRLRLKPDRRQTVGEVVYEAAQVQIAEQGLPTKAMSRWFPYVATLALFIWVINMIGFVP